MGTGPKGDEPPPGKADDGEPRRPPRVRFLRVLGVAKVAEAAVVILWVIGTILFLFWSLRLDRFPDPGNRSLRAYFIERFLALPVLGVCFLRLGRRLFGLGDRAILCQAILSSVVASWMLISARDLLDDLWIDLELFDTTRGLMAIRIAACLGKLGSGLAHFGVAVSLFRIRRRITDVERRNTEIPGDGRIGCGPRILGGFVGLVLAIGTIVTVQGIIMEVVHQVLSRAAAG